MIPRHLRDRYSRQVVFPGIGEEGQEKLLKSTAVIIGCGALGGHIATFLVRAGVGKVKIVDRDFIEYHNLHRQVLFDEDDIEARLPKAIAAARHLKRMNATVAIEGIVADVNYTNIESFCRGADVILDGLDNLETRFLINDVALKHKVPWIYGGAIAAEGTTMSIIPGKPPCFRCFSPNLFEARPRRTCETAGVIGTVPGIIGALQATEAVKIIVGSKAINRDVLLIDVWEGTCHRLEVKQRDDCPACHGEYEFLQKRFGIKTDVLCGQSRSVQVLNTAIRQIDLDKLAEKLSALGEVKREESMLTFATGEYEVMVFPDGRAIIRNTLDTDLAEELYRKYVTAQVS